MIPSKSNLQISISSSGRRTAQFLTRKKFGALLLMSSPGNKSHIFQIAPVRQVSEISNLRLKFSRSILPDIGSTTNLGTRRSRHGRVPPRHGSLISSDVFNFQQHLSRLGL